MLSKLLELHFLEKCDQYKFNSCQYGFISYKIPSTASSVLHDVSTYCTAKGSSVYMCSLDAQGAFGAIPIPLLLHKAMNVLPDSCWQTLYYWYHNMSVQIRWTNRLGKSIAVKIGTKEGGLFCPFLFNQFYEKLVSDLNSEECGISIGQNHFNVFCYADDLLLCSLTVSGLQKLINIANKYILEHGLAFNPAITRCMTFGRKTLTSAPLWNINDEHLGIYDHN